MEQRRVPLRFFLDLPPSRRQQLCVGLLQALFLAGSLLLGRMEVLAEVESRETERARWDTRREQMKELDQKLGFDQHAKRFTPPYSEGQIQLLLATLRDLDAHIRKYALDRLAFMLRQGGVPEEVRKEQFKPLINALAAGPTKAEDKDAGWITEHAQQVLWHLKVNEIPDGPERREFLLGYIVPKRQYYYAFEAMRYLVAMESEEAKTTLLEALEQTRQRLVRGKIVPIEGDSRILKGLQNSIEKVNILLSVKALDTPTQIARLAQVLEEHKDDYTTEEENLVFWLLDRIARFTHPDAIQVLQKVWQSERYKSYQVEAGVILVRLKVLTPDDLVRAGHILHE